MLYITENEMKAYSEKMKIRLTNCVLLSRK